MQCSIPVFEGLLPEPHNTILLDLLFLLAQWHGLAKLRLHTDDTLKIMDQVTVALGNQLREFQNITCASFETRELKREAEARKRRQAKTQNTRPSSSTQNVGADKSRRLKTLNLETYKLHALGDYTATIRRYGTTDSYSTEMVIIDACTDTAIYLCVHHYRPS
jgi:hypothetical protein